MPHIDQASSIRAASRRDQRRNVRGMPTTAVHRAHYRTLLRTAACASVIAMTVVIPIAERRGVRIDAGRFTFHLTSLGCSCFHYNASIGFRMALHAPYPNSTFRWHNYLHLPEAEFSGNSVIPTYLCVPWWLIALVQGTSVAAIWRLTRINVRRSFPIGAGMGMSPASNGCTRSAAAIGVRLWQT